jgi:hypothetical protein
MIHRDSAAPPGDLTDTVPETMDGLLRHVDRRSATYETEPDIFEFLRGNDAALLQVHDKVKFACQITMDRCEDTLCTSFRPREDHEVVRIAHEAKSSVLQLFVHGIAITTTNDTAYLLGCSLPRMWLKAPSKAFRSKPIARVRETRIEHRS